MKREQVFDVLEPPPNGLTRLRAAMNERQRRVRWALLASAAVCLCLVIVKTEQQPPNEFATQFSIRWQMLEQESVVSLGGTAVEKLPSRAPGVVMYRITAW